MRKITLFEGGNIAVAENMKVQLIGKKIIEEIDITKKTEKEIKKIKEQLTKSFKDSNIKKADDLAADSDKRTLI